MEQFASKNAERRARLNRTRACDIPPPRTWRELTKSFVRKDELIANILAMYWDKSSINLSPLNAEGELITLVRADALTREVRQLNGEPTPHPTPFQFEE